MAKRSKNNSVIIDENLFVEPKKVLNLEEFQPLTLSNKQSDFHKKIMSNDIIFCTGPAGTSKTFVSCYTGLYLLATGAIEKIILVKPIRESGESLGYLPGDINDKIDPFFESFYTNIREIIGEKKCTNLISKNIIQSRPLAYMRGATFNKSFIFVDESQNCTTEQLMLCITRLGKQSKMILAGDTAQSDIHKKESPLEIFRNLISDVSGVSSFKFERQDIVRNKILIDIVDKYEELKYGKAEYKNFSGNGNGKFKVDY